MSMPQHALLYTVDEYLKMERDSLERHEYLDGQIFLMAGESLPHGRISLNLAGIFYNQLRGKPCEALTKDTKVRSGATPMPGESTAGLFSYPDLLVVCGEIEFHDAVKDMILNPRLILEVLSPSTEDFCRHDKFERYKRWNPQFTDYLLVSQDAARIEHRQRQPDGTWTERTYTGMDAVFAIPSVQCTIALADVYDRVVWDGK
jgi:Uma2 family endonuclease